MEKPSIFQFKSITHRLIFSCIVAAIGIYSFSYWQARQTLHGVLSKWVVDIAQSWINNVVSEIEGNLQAVERSVLLPVQNIQSSGQNSNYSPKDRETFFPFLKTLVEEQPKVEAITLIDIPKSSSGSSAVGWHYARQSGYTNLNVNETQVWLSRCQSDRATSTIKPFWTQPYPLKNSDSLRITYCIPLFQSSDRTTTINSTTERLLAIEVKLDWVSPFMTQQLDQPNRDNYFNLGDPFILATASGHWIVKPKQPQGIQELISQNASTWRENQRSNGLIETKINAQDTLIARKLPSHQDWVIGIVFSSTKLEQFEQQYLWLVILSMSKDMVLVCIVIALISQLTTRPLRALIVSTEEMAKGKLDTTLPPVTSGDEVGRLTESFCRMRDALKIHIQDLQETTAAKQKLESELSIAAQIQRTMVPKINLVGSPNSSYEISALLKPARIVGGDFYDFFLLGSDRLCLIIGDVADKGFPAALLMARTVTLIRTLTKPPSRPSDILSMVNQELCIDNDECLFVTVLCVVINLETGEFTYASGGHDAPMLIRDRKAQYLALKSAPPLGLYEESEFPPNHDILFPNDLILFYTDGITEAMNLKGEFFSDSRLIELMNCYPPTNPARTIRSVQRFCQRFVGDAPQSDDITLLAMQYLPSNPFSQVANIMEWNLTINSELTELEEVRQYLNEILQASDLTTELIEDAQLIVEEVLVNIIQHGYENTHATTDASIDLRIEIDDKYLVITFTDSGKPFNPFTEIAPPDLNMDDEERSQGGFGFFLVQELADKIDYAYCNGKNILTVYQAIAKAA